MAHHPNPNNEDEYLAYRANLNQRERNRGFQRIPRYMVDYEELRKMRSPVYVTCPHCRHRDYSKVKFKMGYRAWIWVVSLLLPLLAFISFSLVAVAVARAVSTDAPIAERLLGLPSHADVAA